MSDQNGSSPPHTDPDQIDPNDYDPDKFDLGFALDDLEQEKRDLAIRQANDAKNNDSSPDDNSSATAASSDTASEYSKLTDTASHGRTESSISNASTFASTNESGLDTKTSSTPSTEDTSQDNDSSESTPRPRRRMSPSKPAPTYAGPYGIPHVMNHAKDSKVVPAKGKDVPQQVFWNGPFLSGNANRPPENAVYADSTRPARPPSDQQALSDDESPPQTRRKRSRSPVKREVQAAGVIHIPRTNEHKRQIEGAEVVKGGNEIRPVVIGHDVVQEEEDSDEHALEDEEKGF